MRSADNWLDIKEGDINIRRLVDLGIADIQREREKIKEGARNKRVDC